MSEARDRWLAFAYEDLKVAELVFEADLYNQVCFHSQQCVEKALKALIAQQQDPPPRTHSITDLLQLLPKTWLSDVRDELDTLDDYYIPTRYPDALPGSLPEGLPGKSQAVEALALARAVLDWITGNVDDELTEEQSDDLHNQQGENDSPANSVIT